MQIYSNYYNTLQKLIISWTADDCTMHRLGTLSHGCNSWRNTVMIQ